MFKPQCAPEGAALRCLDGCKAKDHCPFDAEKIYLKDPKIGVENGYTQWPVNVLTLHPTVESVTQAIQNGPYGRCVYHCDNNVVDHQVVNLKMTDGSTISHTMCAFTATGSRYAKFMGTMGEIIADMTANTIQITPFGKDTETIDINQIASDFFGHGGGDKRMVEDFIDMLLSEMALLAIPLLWSSPLKVITVLSRPKNPDYTTALLWSLTNSENRQYRVTVYYKKKRRDVL